MMGEMRHPFSWSMEGPGRLVVRYRKLTDEGASGGAVYGIFDIEIKIQETEFAPWPVITNRSSDVFGNLWCALARVDPPLVLPVRLPAARPKRTLLSRMRDVFARHL
jgi:hypothetical protein